MGSIRSPRYENRDEEQGMPISKEAALENSPENLEDQRRRSVARQARDGVLPGGDRRTSR
jgi:hypothetical protein